MAVKASVSDAAAKTVSCPEVEFDLPEAASMEGPLDAQADRMKLLAISKEIIFLSIIFY